MEINQNDNELHLYPINNNEYLGAIKVNASSMRNDVSTIFILDQSGSMGTNVERFVTKITPLVMSKLGYAYHNRISLITFDDTARTHHLTSNELKASNITKGGSTNFAPAIQALHKLLEQFSKNSSNYPIRVLTISDGAIHDHPSAANETKRLTEFLAGTDLMINSQAVRLFTSSSQPDTKALSYLLQINNTVATQLYDAKDSLPDETIATEIAKLFQRDCFRNYTLLHFEKSIALKFPWNSHASIHVVLSPGWNIFWFKQVPSGVKLSNGNTVKVVVQSQLSLGMFHELMESTLEYITDHMIVLKIVGTPEALGTVNRIFECLKKQEDAVAQKSSTSNNKIMSNLLDGIAKNETNLGDSKQMAEFLRNTKNEIKTQRDNDRKKREEEARLKKIADDKAAEEKAAREKAAEIEKARLKKIADDKAAEEKAAEAEKTRLQKIADDKAAEEKAANEKAAEAARLKLKEEEDAKAAEEARLKKIADEEKAAEAARLKLKEEEDAKAADEAEKEKAALAQLEKQKADEAARVKQQEEEEALKRMADEKVAEEEAALKKLEEEKAAKEEEEARIKKLGEEKAAEIEAARIKRGLEELNRTKGVEADRMRQDENERLEKELDITTYKSNLAGGLTSFQTVFILDEYLAGARENSRFTEKIVPLMMSRIFNESSELVHFVTFVRYQTDFKQLCSSLQGALDASKQLRILVLTNEQMQGRQDTDNLAEMLIKFLNMLHYSYEFHVARLVSTTTTTTEQHKVVDVGVNQSNDFIAQQVATEFVGKQLNDLHKRDYAADGGKYCWVFYIIFVIIFILLIFRYINLKE